MRPSEEIIRSLHVQAGQNVYFEASGEVRWGPNRRDGPGGEQNSPVNPSRPMPNRPGAALIGRVGANSDYFYIGGERGPIRMLSAGRLFLAVPRQGQRQPAARGPRRRQFL